MEGDFLQATDVVSTAGNENQIDTYHSGKESVDNGLLETMNVSEIIQSTM